MCPSLVRRCRRFLTVGDNDLTLRDMTAMARAGSKRGYLALVRKLGGNPDELLQQHRLTSQMFDDENALVPADQVARLMEGTAYTLRCPDFGLQMANYQDISTLGPLAIAIQHSQTAREAVANASRYLFLQVGSLSLSVVGDPASPELTELRYDIRLPHMPVAMQSHDLALGVTHRIIGLMFGERYRLHSVSLPHRPIAPPSTYQRFFGAPVRFAEPYAALRIPRSLLDEPIPTFNETMRELAVHYLESHFAGPEHSISSRVRLALLRSLGTPQAEIAGIAGMLAMHPRTLQRQLSAEHTTFESIRDQVRQETAMRYLANTDVALAQIAALVGLSEHSALTRCCKRWFGRTPSEIRHEAAGLKPAD